MNFTNNKIHALIIEDLPDNRQLLRLDLEDEIPGIQLTEASNGLEGLALLEKNSYTIVICDVLMPGMDGFTVLKNSRQIPHAAGTPYLFLSALRQPETIRQGLKLGAVDYMTKPYDVEELVYKVMNLSRIKFLQDSLQESERSLIEANKHLQELNQDKNRVMQIVSHDLRSPLSGIKGLSNILMLEDDANDVKVVREFAGIIHSTSELLLKLVNDLLNITRIESESVVSMELSEFNIAEMIHSSIINFEKLASHKQISLSVEYPDRNLTIIADKPKIIQVLNNLISNSVKFTKSGGSISISCGQKTIDGKDFISFSVADTGIGIPEEFMPKLFEKFGDHKRRGTDDEKGVGLGLPIVQRFVEIHKGTIEVKSREGEGTTIIILIPKDTSESL